MPESHTSSSEPIEVTVESLGGLGDGIANHNGKPLFIAKSCDGDRLKVCIVHESKEALQGRIVEVMEGGPHRQVAPCAYFDQCGGCSLQQLAEEHYRNFKTRMMHESLSRAGFPMPDAQVTFIAPRSRRRVEFKIHPIGDKVVMAFYGLRSHVPVVIKECLVLKPELDALISPLNKALSVMPFAPYLYAVSLTSADSGIEMVLTLKSYDISRLPDLAELCKKLGLARISVRTPDSRPMVVVQLSPVEMQLGNYLISLPPEAFLQATAEGQTLLTDLVMSATKNAASVIDLFCGIGTYSFPLSGVTKTHAVEGETVMARVIRKSVQRHGITTLTSEQRDLFKKPMTAKELAKFDAVILNPPRVGAKAQTEQLAESSVSTVVMISCNPATFTRDAKILREAGFMLESVQGIDQFLWSQHLEIAAVFRC